MGRQPGLFLARLFTNTHKDDFIVRLGVTLLLGKFGLKGSIFKILDFLLRSVMGLLVETGVFQIDLALDAYREGKKLDEFKRDAAIAFEKATAKKYTEEEKNEIRNQYLKIIRNIGNVGNPK